ncbi:amidohydrolase [Algoriphagus halophytocola]|uniref:Amidohydrolase n=1 Tax=Algoriphagus halophytocola TaxID=2991499 RepID=A0ABY6MGH3_9BACT|nr:MULTISPECIES: amidohydrolase [unclassified Algoriphagus]UZD21736.1 amidohydrolase [Algoriphagus sp. TR-M5]WBL42948.1 amidohydrolase [Algoriphagus sp. TR-M9]
MPLTELIKLRHDLHENPEIAGQETHTAERILGFIDKLKPDHIIQNLGGTGLAFIFEGKKPGPRLLFRAELDALPIHETGKPSYKSKLSGKAHLCGHDGHMVIICGLAEKLAAQRPENGEVVLLFQPAEETGEGAKRILEDPNYDRIQPDYAFALHNLPGFPLHQVVVRQDTFAAGSVGLTISLTGKTSHAAHPDAGINPAAAIAQMIQVLPKLTEKVRSFTLVTVIHAELGSLAFGTSAGKGSLSLTIRAFDQDDLDRLKTLITKEAESISKSEKLECNFSFVESFAVSKNDPHAAEIAKGAFKELGLDQIEKEEPFRWSEDFGLFSQSCPSYLFGLGSGESCPQLHEPSYDFPDELIETGVRIFEGIVRKVNG